MKIYSSEMIKTKLHKQKQVKKILKHIFYPLAVFIMICAIGILYQKFIKKQTDISLFGLQPYIILSGSMEPDLRIGDMVISRKVKEGQVDIGDIITFEDESGAVITHRVIDIIIQDGVKLYQTKGDNNNAEDTGFISAENIRGEYTFKISGAGKFISWLMTPTGLIVILLVMTAGYMAASRKYDRKIARHSIRERYKKRNVI